MRLAGQPVEIPSRSAQSLLAFLLLNPIKPHRREMLAGLFWPEASEANARSNLRHALWRIRKALMIDGWDYLLADDLTISFRPMPGDWLDVAVLDGKVGEAEAVAELTQAVSVYQGELLPGFYDEWVLLERGHLQAVFEQKMQRLLNLLVGAQRWPEALQLAEGWIARGDTPEPAYRALMLAHAGMGDQASVAQVYQRCIQALQAALGVEPSEQTRTTYKQLIRGASPPGRVSPAIVPSESHWIPPLPAESPAPAAAFRLPTKFYLPPPPAGFVARPQLLKILDEALTHRLTLVSAPAGAGKTTLVSAWVQPAREKGAAIGWLSLDEGDNDPGRFLDYLVACLEEGGTAIDTANLSPARRAQSGVENVLGDILRGVAPLKREIMLILDDYHHIHNRAVHAALETLLDHAPSHLHLALLTRSDPPLELARLRVAGQLVEVRMEHLRFSEKEAAAFLKKAAGVQLTEEDVAALNERTEGWIAGLQMAAISMHGRADASAFVAAFAGSHRYVFDYLLEQVLNRQAPEVREFLLKTSVLERLSAPLCEAVAETGGAACGLLGAIERANLFLVPLDDERGWYRYHHLFADLLRLMLEQTHPGLAAELHRRACHWHEAQGMISEALQHAISSGDMQLVAQIVSANVLVLVENDEAAPTLQKIDSLPPDKMTALPWLGIARAWASGAGQVRKSQQILDAVEKNAENAPDSLERRRLKGHIAAARAYGFSIQGDKSNTLAQARQANELLPADEIAVRALNLTIWGDVLSVDGHDPSAIPILDQALALAFQARKPHVAMIAVGALASAHLGAGKLHELHHECQEALAVAEDYQRRFHQPLSAAGNVYSLLARVLAEWGESEKAVEFARKGLALSERWGQADENETISLGYLGRVLAFGNDWEQARQMFQRADRIAQKLSPWLWQMTTILALDSLLDCEAPDASEIAGLKRRVQESGARYPAVLTARLLLRDDKPGEALAALEQALSELNGQPSLDLVRIYGLRALAFQAQGDAKQALAALRQALELGEPENRVATFMREGPAMEKLLRVAQANAIAPEFVQRLLAACAACRKAKTGPALVSEALLEPLSERELEVLRHLDGPLSTPEIAELLVVSANTVRTHIKNIYGKLGVHGRSGAVRRAKELGLLA